MIRTERLILRRARPDDLADVHAMLFIPDSVANKAEILARIRADMVNQPGSPLRVVVGGVPPEVVDALPDWAYRKALDRHRQGGIRLAERPHGLRR